MRKIIVLEMISLDGFFETKNKEPDWHIRGEDFLEYSRELLNSVDVILFGRITYQMMEAFWPNATEENAAITHKMNHLNKIVFTKTLKKVTWNNSEIAKESLEEEVLKLKKQRGKDIVIFGSGSIVNELTELDLIDEYRFVIIPVVLGKGNTLFKGLEDGIKMKLLKAKMLDSGVVILCYARNDE